MSETETNAGKSFVEQSCREQCEELHIGAPEFDWRPEGHKLGYELHIRIPDRDSPIQCRISRAQLDDDRGFQAAYIAKRAIAGSVRRPSDDPTRTDPEAVTDELRKRMDEHREQ